MTDPATPNPADVQRGEAALTTALRISTLLPREQDAIFSILHSLNTADEWLPRLAGQPNSDTYAMRLLAAIVDNYRSAIGSAVEWYDYFLYGTMAGIVFGPL